MDRNIEAMKNAMAGSIAAAIIIQAILTVVIARGVDSLYTPYILPGLAILLAIAGYVYRNLLASTIHSRSTVRVMGLLGALIAGVGVLVGLLWSPTAGAVLIVVAYYGELVLGVRLRRDLEEVGAAGVREFIYGMLIFILSLPLALLDNRLALIPFAGNLLKTYGLIHVYSSLSRRA